MFVQVIQGKVTDRDKVRAALDRWIDELSAGARGWLGSTAGVTEDGTLVALARFESEEAARRNSERPEQDAWWTETAKLFTGAPTFRDSTSVVADVIGDPDQAGFVQIIQGRGNDPDRAQAMMTENSQEWAAFRPDIIGSLSILHEGGYSYTMALYFTSEEAAREGERKEPPPELKAQMEEMDSLSVGVPDFFDLKQPWLHSPD